MIIGDEIRLEINFVAAQARLTNLVHAGSLLDPSRQAYGDGLTSLVQVGPLGAAPGLSKLVEVRFRDLVTHDDRAVLTLRWEATGLGGGLFPVLDADITLTPDGDEATVLRLEGAYRPPLGSLGAGLDRAILHRAALATVGSFISRIAEVIIHPATATELAPERVRSEAPWFPPLPEMP